MCKLKSHYFYDGPLYTGSQGAKYRDIQHSTFNIVLLMFLFLWKTIFLQSFYLQKYHSISQGFFSIDLFACFRHRVTGWMIFFLSKWSGSGLSEVILSGQIQIRIFLDVRMWYRIRIFWTLYFSWFGSGSGHSSVPGSLFTQLYWTFEFLLLQGPPYL